ncbi:DUF1176 domain-containing protein [Phenylobacterium sp.]|jgi:hypothetical protein|uniref:DUF1176 domain-containing protein n=1 Tax=Phenylobacterium sp. TaxID=1871053 RepID=UPI002E367A3B|nr:DUF1176 domain-containing protein [Phenylobacterium sp.]HEX2558507.1 DUF1176 domain-containing protein [Phenylobacterium sp.]
MRAALIGLVAAGLAALCGPASAENESFGDWIVVCDNIRTCNAYGFPEEHYENITYIRITRTGAAGAAPTVSISASGEGSAVWRLEIDGIPVMNQVQAIAGKDEVYQRAVLTPAQTATLLKGLANGEILSIWLGRDVVGAISLKGSSAALRWVDDRQKRAGTVTALVAKGPKPASAMPAPPAPPVIRAAAPASQAGLPKSLPDAIKYPWESCDDDIGELGIEPQVFRLAPGLLLWQTACSRGAYNVVYDFSLLDEKGTLKGAPDFPYASGQAETGRLMNAEFDPATQTLSNFDKARGLGDCGAFTSWVWTGREFALKGSEVMPDCRGVPLDDWPTEFVSR